MAAKATNKDVDAVVEEKKVETPVTEEQATENQLVVTEVESEEPVAAFSFAGMDLASYGFSEEELKNLTGLEAIDSSEIRIPYATLVAKPNRENDVGDIIFPDGTTIKGYKGEVAEEVCVLKIQPVRVYFPSPFSPKNNFICRSLDGKVGAPDGEYAGRACAECEFSSYPEGGGSSPCRDQRLLLCTLADGSLFHLQVSGVGVKVWKNFMSAQAFHLLPKCNQIFGALKISIGSKIIDTDFGPFPAIEFNINKKDPFVTMNRVMANLTSLKSYKEFEREHTESAALHTKVEMAVSGENQAGEEGKNTKLF